MLIFAAHDPADHVLPHRFFELLPFNLNFGAKKIPILNFDFGPDKFYFTNHHLMMLVAAGLCLWLLPKAAGWYSRPQREPDVPRGFTNLIESLLCFVRDGVARPVLGPRTDEFVPFLWTLFFFILLCNLLGMIPLDSIVYLATGRTVRHVGGTATGEIGVTGGLALCALFTIHISGIQAVYRGLMDGTYGHHDHGEAHDDHDHDHGHGHSHHHGMSAGAAAICAAPLYVWNFAPHVFKPGPGTTGIMRPLMWLIDLPMWVVLLVLETIGALIKPFALMIRLFANMIAGHIVLGSIVALIFISGSYFVGIPVTLGCVALSFLELFVAFLQAYIFVFLTTLFIGMAVAPEH